MRDELFDRNYQDGRAHLNAGIDRGIANLAKGLSQTFKVLHRIEWSAPWAAARKPAGRA
jgi:hypothetical protein